MAVTRAVQPSIEHHHRDIQTGSARAAVFGVSDGLVSNVSLILGVAGANPQPGVVRLAGMAGLIAGAVSMAAGEYVSMRAQAELFERELDIERRELERNPHSETVELTQHLRGAGRAARAGARALAEDMMRDPDVALETHAREELGIDPGSLGSPCGAALSSFLAFAVGALIPLLPVVRRTGDAAVDRSVVLGALGALAVGVALARFTGRSPCARRLRQLLIAAVAATVTFWSVG